MKRTVLLSVFLWLVAGLTIAYGQNTETALSAPEQRAMSDTLQYALENNKTNQTSDWVNPDVSHSGAVVPIKTFHNAQGLPCREFITTITIAGKAQQGYGTACRQPDGTWQIVDTSSQSNVASAPPPPPPPPTTYVYSPPAYYYAYPPSFFGPYHIFLSFSYVYRDGRFYRGSYYMDGRHFRSRYPFHVRERVYIGPHFFYNGYRRHGVQIYRERHRIHDRRHYRSDEWWRKHR